MESSRRDFRAAVLDDRMMQVRRKNRVRVASESAAAGLKGPSTRSRSRLLSESVAGSKKAAAAAEGHDKAATGLASRLGLHSHPAPTFSLLHSKVKEERKCVLRASERKYNDIVKDGDPEEVLLRYVLVSNAMKNLQIKMRREKAAKRANVGNKAFTRL